MRVQFVSAREPRAGRDALVRFIPVQRVYHNFPALAKLRLASGWVETSA
jgi:hypothetical protein